MNWPLGLTLALEQQLHSSKTGKASEAPRKDLSNELGRSQPSGRGEAARWVQKRFQQQAVCYVGTAFYQTASKQDTCVRASC